MKRLVVLGAGTAGTVVVNRLRRKLPEGEWQITVVDRDLDHHYQPGYLFIPFGFYQPSSVVKPRLKFIPKGVSMLVGEIELVDPDAGCVLMTNGIRLDYDQLVIATGVAPRPDQTTGMDGPEWGKSVFDFYTLEGATALRDTLDAWDGGRLVVHVTEMPIKCPVAPLEFAFLADAFFKDRGMRDRVELTFVTPLDAAFTKPVAARLLGGMLSERKIGLEPDFYVESIDNAGKALVSYDERVVPFDLLVTVPVNMGADFISRSGLGNELNCVPVDHGTFLSTEWDNIFAIGDAADIPTSKAGSVAHFAIDLFVQNFLQHIEGEEMTHVFDGHANCFVESGDRKAMLIDFNYDIQPLPGKYPLPVIGPLSLMKETEVNHLAKLMFKWTYWNALLPGRNLPIPPLMSMAGKKEEADE